MRYTSRGITADGRAGVAEGETHRWRACARACRGIGSIACTWKRFPKSAAVGEEDGAVQRKAPAGFLPVHRCRSPHVRLIQSHRHQMPRECQTQSLKRQRAPRRTRKKHRHGNGARARWRIIYQNADDLLDWEDGSYTE